MPNLPFYISVIFILTTLYTVIMFLKAANFNKTVLYFLFGWLLVQGLIGLSGFYTNTLGMPPRFMLTVGPAIVVIIFLFATSKGKAFLDKLNLQTLTLLHLARIPVELVLLWLFLHKAVPRIMTFEGANLDVFSGLTALVAWWLARNNHGRILLLWNVVCLGLLINIVVIAVLSAPFAFQKLSFEQPNIAILYFPYVWLPACVVPLVLLSHLAAIRQLATKSNKYKTASLQQI